MTIGKLFSHLADVDQWAHEMFPWLVDQLAKQDGVTEKAQSR